MHIHINYTYNSSFGGTSPWWMHPNSEWSWAEFPPHFLLMHGAAHPWDFVSDPGYINWELACLASQAEVKQ